MIPDVLMCPCCKMLIPLVGEQGKSLEWWGKCATCRQLTERFYNPCACGRFEPRPTQGFGEVAVVIVCKHCGRHEPRKEKC